MEKQTQPLPQPGTSMRPYNGQKTNTVHQQEDTGYLTESSVQQQKQPHSSQAHTRRSQGQTTVCAGNLTLANGKEQKPPLSTLVPQGHEARNQSGGSWIIPKYVEINILLHNPQLKAKVSWETILA